MIVSVIQGTVICLIQNEGKKGDSDRNNTSLRWEDIIQTHTLMENFSTSVHFKSTIST